VNPIAFADRRTAEQIRHSDNLIEKRWRWRVLRTEVKRVLKPTKSVAWPVIQQAQAAIAKAEGRS